MFLPYQSVFIPNYLVKDVNSTRNIVNYKKIKIFFFSYILIAKFISKHFPIDLKFYLEKAIEHRHLILTIPFIVEFLSMCDENAISISIINETFSLLINIFR